MLFSTLPLALLLLVIAAPFLRADGSTRVTLHHSGENDTDDLDYEVDYLEGFAGNELNKLDRHVPVPLVKLSNAALRGLRMPAVGLGTGGWVAPEGAKPDVVCFPSVLFE